MVGKNFESAPSVPSPSPYFIAPESIAERLTVPFDILYVWVNNEATLETSCGSASPFLILSATDSTVKAIAVSCAIRNVRRTLLTTIGTFAAIQAPCAVAKIASPCERFAAFLPSFLAKSSPASCTDLLIAS